MAALRRCGVTDGEAVHTAAQLLAKAATDAPLAGRALFAANRALPWPDEPVALPLARKHPAARTTRRRPRRPPGRPRHRGPANPTSCTRSATGWPATSSCAADGTTTSNGRPARTVSPRGEILDGQGRLTDSGRTAKAGIENATDELALAAFDALDDGELELLFRTLTPITRAVIGGGDIPAVTPMGLRRDDLADDGAHLD